MSGSKILKILDSRCFFKELLRKNIKTTYLSESKSLLRQKPNCVWIFLKSIFFNYRINLFRGTSDVKSRKKKSAKLTKISLTIMSILSIQSQLTFSSTKICRFSPKCRGTQFDSVIQLLWVKALYFNMRLKFWINGQFTMKVIKIFTIDRFPENCPTEYRIYSNMPI
jgi:hypothetical protein